MLRCCCISTLVLTCFRLKKDRATFFTTRNNCCEFLASEGVIFQIVMKPIYRSSEFSMSSINIQLGKKSHELLMENFSENLLECSVTLPRHSRGIAFYREFGGHCTHYGFYMHQALLVCKVVFSQL